MATFARFLGVGLVNSVIGYGVILLGLWLGWGDYRANAAGYVVGLLVSYVLQRRWAFAVTNAATAGEILRFGGAALVAYAANLLVIFLGTRAGYTGNWLVQAIAMAAYSLTFFVMSRYVVFAQDAGQASGK